MKKQDVPEVTSEKSYISKLVGIPVSANSVGSLVIVCLSNSSSIKKQVAGKINKSFKIKNS
jgi:hypothetical protein